MVKSRIEQRELATRSVQLIERDRAIEALTVQCAERDRLVEELRTRCTEQEQALQTLTGELENLKGSMAWGMAQSLQRARITLAPRGTVRWRILRLGWRGARVLAREGLLTFGGKAARKIVMKVIRMTPFAPALLRSVPVSAAEAPDAVEDSPTGALAVAVFEPPQELPPYEAWVENNRWNEQSLRAADDALSNLPRRPFFSVVMPVYNIDDCWLEKAVESVQTQVYPHWELCIVDDASTAPNVRRLLRRLAGRDARIKVRYLSENHNISLATNAAAELAQGEYLVLMDQDDELTPDCLLELASAVVNDESPDIIYSDDDKIDEQGRRSSPQFKPDWSPELLLGYMYLSHVFCIRRDQFEKVGGFRAGFEGCQDYDLALRLSERTSRFAHVPKVLYHWRTLPGSTASSGAAKPEAFTRGIRAVQESLDRRGITAWVSRPDFAVKNHMGLFQLDFPDEGPAVAIVIPTCHRQGALLNGIRSILERTTYRNYEIVVVDDASGDPKSLEFLKTLPPQCRTIRIAPVEADFSGARLCNEAVERLDAEYIVFLKADSEVRRPEWLSQLVGYGQFPGVGVVGARLLLPDGRVKHGGVITGHFEGMPRFAFESTPEWDGGYQCYALVTRNYSAVSGACLLVRRDLYRAIGGYDEVRFASKYHDIDLCLRLREEGWRCVYVPRAELIDHESGPSVDTSDPKETWAYQLAWGHDRDPYYSPNLTHAGVPFTTDTRRTTAPLATSHSPVRVLFCNHDLGLEGAPLYVYKLAIGLLARGRVAPEIYAPSDGPLAVMYREAGIPVHHPSFATTDSDPELGHARAIRMYADWIRGSGFDVVHGNTLSSFTAIEAARAAGLPSLWTIHESVDFRSYFHQFGAAAVEPALHSFTYPYQVIFVAHATRALYKPLETRHNFSVIHVGLKREPIERFMIECTPQQARARIGCPPEKRVITILGTVADRKGQHVFARAALELLRNGRRDVFFLIVGCRPSSYLDELKAMIQEHGADFRLVPATPDVYPYYRASDVFVCCSTNESYPAVILEAMAFGLPIITTPVFGIAEQVKHGASALTFQPGDAATLVEHLHHLLDNPDQRERLAEGSYLTLNTIISHDEMIRVYEEMIVEAFLAAAAAPPRELAGQQRGVA